MGVLTHRTFSHTRLYCLFCVTYNTMVSYPSLPQCPLERLLADPHCLAPPKLGVGEFHADTDEASIEEAFYKHAGASSKVWYVYLRSSAWCASFSRLGRQDETCKSRKKVYQVYMYVTILAVPPLPCCVWLSEGQTSLRRGAMLRHWSSRVTNIYF